MGKKKGISFKIKLLIMSLVPALLIGIVVLVTGIVELRSNMTELSLDQLDGVASSVEHAYSKLFMGDWEYDAENDRIMKSGHVIDDDYLEKILETEGVYATIFYQDTRYLTSLTDVTTGEKLVGTKCSDEVAAKVLKGGARYEATDTVINNEKYFAVYHPLMNKDGSVFGMIFAGIPQANVQSNIFKAIFVMLGTSLVILAIAIVLVILIALTMNKTINNASKAVVALADGDLSQHVEIGKLNRKDEIGALAGAINSLSEKLREVTGAIKESSAFLNDNAEGLTSVALSTNTNIEEVGRAIGEVATGATHQASETQDAANNLETLSSAIEEISDEISSLVEKTATTTDTSHKASNTMEELISINNETKESVKKIVKQAEDNASSANEIQSIVGVISNIASQINLLSLNASIEAARAGEAGRGFSVVAMEIGKLADESSNAANEIGNIINQLVAKINETSSLTVELDTATREQIEKLETTREDFSNVITDVAGIADVSDEVRRDLEKVVGVQHKMNEIIEALSAISEENAASCEETAASANLVAQSMNELNDSAQNINAQAQELNAIVAYFKE